MAKPRKTVNITKTTSAIPYIPRFLINTLEPLFAIGGVILLLTNPAEYIAQLSRTTVADLHPAALGPNWIFTELAGGWLVIIFLEGVVLRLVDDVKVWRLVLCAVLLSDLLYCHSLAEAVGGWVEWVKITEWTSMDWIATLTTWPFVLARVGIVTGLIGGGKEKSV